HHFHLLLFMTLPPPTSTLFPYTTLFRSDQNLVRAHSGLEALEKLIKEEFAVVLLDVSMPDMDGFEAARLIHEHPRNHPCPACSRSEEHTSELQSRGHLVCRLLLEKKKNA